MFVLIQIWFFKKLPSINEYFEKLIILSYCMALMIPKLMFYDFAYHEGKNTKWYKTDNSH